jgi:hypothetical protein
MTGLSRAGAPSDPEHSPNTDKGGQSAQGLAESRGCLIGLEERVRELDENPESTSLGEGQQYWLYEHLRRLSIQAESLLELFERKQLEFPIVLSDIIIQCLNPLQEIYSDLLAYYWRAGCLMERLAVTQVDQELLATTREIRKDWGSLATAIGEYLAARQDEDAQKRPKSLIATGGAFHRTFLTFVKTLQGLVARNAFKSNHARLADSLGLSSRTSRRRPKSGGGRLPARQDRGRRCQRGSTAPAARPR